MNPFAANLRKLRLEKQLTQEQAAEQLGVSAQSVSRWETGATFPDVMLLPQIARLYGVLVDDLFKPSPAGYENNALRLLAVFERTGKYEDFTAAAAEFERIIRADAATADDWRSYGVIHEYMVSACVKKALDAYDRAMSMSRDGNPEMYYRTLRQKIQLRARIGQAQECISEQEASAKANPGAAEEWNTLAATLFIAGRYEQSLQICREALASFPQEGLLRVCEGDSLRALGRYDEAFAAWEQAVRLDSKFLDALYSTALCQEELGRYGEALETWTDLARRLNERGLEIEAQWPREMAEKCRDRLPHP